MTQKYYVAWSENKQEAFISTDKSDVEKALGRRRVGCVESTLGAAFRDAYGDQKLPRIQTIEI